MMLAAVALTSQAQIVVSVPSHVGGRTSRLSYTINTQDVDEFRAGNIPGGLELIAGLYTSQQSSYRMVNGHTSSSSSITFTYTLYAAKDGSFTIPSAHAASAGAGSLTCRKGGGQWAGTQWWRRSENAW